MSLPAELTYSFIGFYKYITTNIGTIPQYDIDVFCNGNPIIYIVVDNDNVGWAVIDNTENIDKEGVMAFAQSHLSEIENMLENY